jgi:hypothetical protein
MHRATGFGTMLILLALVSPVPARADGGANLQAVNAPAIEFALQRGAQLYAYDQAAWHVTDAMQADIKDVAGAGLRGYIISPTKAGLRVTFYGLKGDKPIGVYTAVWEYGDGKMHEVNLQGHDIMLKVQPVISGRKILQGDQEQRLSDEQSRMIAARELVVQSLSHDNQGFVWQCTNGQMNTAVLPREHATDPDIVYFMTAQVDTPLYPLGGHFRFMVRDGKIVEKRAFTKACANLSDVGEDGKKIKQVILTHLLDPVPTEIHVFTMLSMHLPIGVSTTENGMLWAIENKNGHPEMRLIQAEPSPSIAKP